MSEVVDGIAWTTAMRERVYPSRRIANPAMVVERLSRSRMTFPIDANAARALSRYPVFDRVNEVKSAVARNPAAWRRAVEVAIARASEPLGDELDVDVEAATVALQLIPLYAAMPHWLAAGGIQFALRTLIRCHGIVNGDRIPLGGGAWVIETRNYSVHQPSSHGDAWTLLRCMLADSIEPVYDECHGIADEARLAVRRGKPAEHVCC